MRNAAIAFAAACTALLAGPAPTLAADRFASPGGTDADPCTPEARCDIETAFTSLSSGDRIFLAPGDYGSPNDRIGALSNAGNRIEIVGELRRDATGPWQRPVIYVTNPVSASVLLTGDGGSISDVTIDSESTAAALSAELTGGSAVLLDRVLVHERTGDVACQFAATGLQTARSSACLATAADSSAIETAGSLDLHNVTAMATGAGGRGLVYSTSGATDVRAINSILSGTGAADVTATNTGADATLDLVNSNYDTDNISGSIVLSDPGKQTATPVLANPAAGDLRQLDGSPTVDAGTEEFPPVGNFDLDGDARVQRGGIDIGAYELAPSASAPTDDGDDDAAPPATLPSAPPRTITVVRISRIAVTAKRAKVDRRGRLAIRLACRGGGTRCRGLIALTAKLRLPGHRSKSEIVLARTRFNVAPSRSAKVRIRLGRAARQLLAEARRRRLAAQLRLTAGADERVSKLTLIGPAPKPKPKPKPKRR